MPPGQAINLSNSSCMQQKIGLDDLYQYFPPNTSILPDDILCITRGGRQGCTVQLPVSPGAAPVVFFECMSKMLSAVISAGKSDICYIRSTVGKQI